MNEPYLDCPILILGHPRCGSASLAQAFRSVGVQLGHEQILENGMVSWWHVGFFEKREGLKYFTKSAKDKPPLRAEKVWRYIRRPSDALPSIIIENEFNARENASFKHRRRVILRNFNIDIAKKSAVAAAAYSYLLWNEIAESICDDANPIKVESPHMDQRMVEVGIEKLPKENTTKNKFGLKKEMAPFDDFLREIDQQSARRLLEIESDY